MPLPDVIKISDAAVTRIKELLSGRDTIGIRVGVKTGGCSGLSYTFEYATSIDSTDLKVVSDDVTVLIDPKAEMFLIGTTLDYVDEKVKSGFVFINPNEKGQCGCGKSFSV